MITQTLVSVSSLCLSIGPLGTRFIHCFSPAGLHMLADLHMACRLHGRQVLPLGRPWQHLQKRWPSSAENCPQGTRGHAPGPIRPPPQRTWCSWPQCAEAKVMPNTPQCTWQPPTQRHPACNRATAEPSRTRSPSLGTNAQGK